MQDFQNKLEIKDDRRLMQDFFLLISVFYWFKIRKEEKDLKQMFKVPFKVCTFKLKNFEMFLWPAESTGCSSGDFCRFFLQTASLSVSLDLTCTALSRPLRRSSKT